MSSEQAEDVELQWPVTVTLKHPIDHGSERITQLVFRRGRMGDLKGVKLDGIPSVDQLLMIASRMCGQTTPVLDKLADEDGAEVLDVALFFFARCLKTSKTR